MEPLTLTPPPPSVFCVICVLYSFFVVSRVLTAHGLARQLLYSDRDPVTIGLDKFFERVVAADCLRGSVVIAGAGHFVQEDAGAAVAQHIIRFLEDGSSHSSGDAPSSSPRPSSGQLQRSC